jgi:hypothetical protein
MKLISFCGTPQIWLPCSKGLIRCPYACNMSYESQPPQLYHYNYIWRGVRIMPYPTVFSWPVDKSNVVLLKGCVETHVCHAVLYNTESDVSLFCFGRISHISCRLWQLYKILRALGWIFRTVWFYGCAVIRSRRFSTDWSRDKRHTNCYTADMSFLVWI